MDSETIVMDLQLPDIKALFMCDSNVRLMEIVYYKPTMTLYEALKKSKNSGGSCGFISTSLVASITKFARFDINNSQGKIYKAVMKDGQVKYTLLYNTKEPVSPSKA